MTAQKKKPPVKRAVPLTRLATMCRAGQNVIASILPLRYPEIAVSRCVYDNSIKTHFAIASLNHCEFVCFCLLAAIQKRQTKDALQREELPTRPLSASTRKACLDGNELVPGGHLSGKVGLLTLKEKGLIQ